MKYFSFIFLFNLYILSSRFYLPISLFFSSVPYTHQNRIDMRKKMYNIQENVNYSNGRRFWWWKIGSTEEILYLHIGFPLKFAPYILVFIHLPSGKWQIEWMARETQNEKCEMMAKEERRLTGNLLFFFLFPYHSFFLPSYISIKWPFYTKTHFILLIESDIFSSYVYW